MKLSKKILLLLFIPLGLVSYFNYPRLNILAGFSAKNTASSVFVADRTLAYTDSTDNNFSPVNLTSDKINRKEKSATGSVFGLLKRKAIFREGLGCVLISDDFDISQPFLTPNRSQPNTGTPYPFGNAPQKDTVFSNINYDILNNAVSSMFDPINKTRAVLVIYKNQIIAEKYSTDISKDSKLLGWSMTKSITGTLFGILQCQGKLNVYDRTGIEEWQNDNRKNITIHNLLQMNSGLEWSEDYNSMSDATKMLFMEKDVTKSQIDKPFVGKPNETWNYSSGTTNLLSGILRKQFNSHQEYLDFWYKALIDKIGMNSMVLETDMRGNYVGSSYAWATPRDWAKLGLLYVNNGYWNGEYLFDKDWVNYATSATPSSNGEYGAHIWLNKGGKYPDVPKNLFSFNGYQGQNVFVLPDQKMVIVRMGLTKNPDFNVFLKTVISSIKSRE